MTNPTKFGVIYSPQYPDIGQNSELDVYRILGKSLENKINYDFKFKQEISMISGLQIKHIKKSIRERKNRQRSHDSDLSSVIRRKGESQNRCFKKKHAKISRKMNISYPLIRTCASQGIGNVRFSENLACFVFLKRVLRFAILPYYRRYDVGFFM